MVYSRLLRGLLLCFILVETNGETKAPPPLNAKSLVKVTKFLRDNYQSPSDAQYAIAFNAPADKCVRFLDNNFLEKYPSDTVKDALNRQDRIYKGDNLIAAKPRPIEGTVNNEHSEKLLMNLPNVETSPLANLLKKDPKGCVVFYTYNSPCTKTCTNPQSCYNIFEALKKFGEHKGPIALVFTEVWKYDCNTDITSNLKEIVNRGVPLYKCKGDKCVYCKESKLTECLNTAKNEF